MTNVNQFGFDSSPEDDDEPDMNGQHPVNDGQEETTALPEGVDADNKFAEARHDREFNRKAKNRRAISLAKKGWDVVLTHLCVRPDELHGLASTREIRERSDLTAAFGTGANAINFILSQPFFVALSGPITGTAVSIGVYWLSNLSQKIAARSGDETRPWSNKGFLSFALLSGVLTGLSPWGTGLLLFRHDLNNQQAETIVMEFVNADVTTEIEAAQDKRKRAANRQEDCDEHRRNYEKLKAAGNEAYHISYRLAFGAYMANEPPGRWVGVPESEIPACPAAKLLALEAEADIEQAQAKRDRRHAEVKTVFGDSYLTYLQVEQPDLFEAYFRRALFGYRIRSGVTELAQAQALVVSGKAAPTLVMIVFTLLSAITSYTALALTYHHSKDPLVRQSWSALARSRQIRAINGGEQTNRGEGATDEE